MIFELKHLITENVRELILGQLHLFRNNSEENLLKTKIHYRRSVYTVPSDHFLVQVLQHLTLGNENDEQLYYRITTQGSRLAGPLHFNTETILSGPLSKPWFFKSPVKTFILENSFDKLPDLDYSKVWTDLQPIRAISHPSTDLNFNVLEGKEKRELKGNAFFYLDIGILAIQYKYWLNSVKDYIARPSIQQFVFQYPLVNLLESQFDVAFFNRINAISKDIPIPRTESQNGLALKDLTALANRLAEEVITGLRNSRRDYYQIPAEVPLVFKDTLAEQLVLPDIFFNRQTLGLYTVAYLPYLSFISNIVDTSGTLNKQGPYTHLYHWYYRMINGRYIEAVPGINPQEIQQVLLDEVLTPLLPRP